ncbi:helix-turn-helix domain-containing protein [Anaerotruncus massiliensis (ex Liu et al. 2021)]|uniref:helix-turn-helix domain-containing protein n=1 Tax=Anaerotruncus massiliensis (ex Liu et al. 2021) TaxID=2321404 RepID=UPI003AB2710C
MKSIIAVNVKRIIKDRCLIQAAVARKAGYTPKSFNNMLNGRKVISDYDVKTIANALQVDPNHLFATEDELTEEDSHVQ